MKTHHLAERGGGGGGGKRYSGTLSNDTSE